MDINILDGLPIPFDIDINPNYQNYVPQEIKQGNSSIKLIFRVYNEGVEYQLPSGENIKYILCYRRSDNNGNIKEADIIENNTLIFTDKTHFLTDVCGKLLLSLGYINNNDGTVNYFVQNIEINIIENPLYKSDLPKDETSILMDIISNANNIFNSTTNTTMDTNITDIGIALDARQANPSIHNTLANQINGIAGTVTTIVNRLIHIDANITYNMSYFSPLVTTGDYFNDYISVTISINTLIEFIPNRSETLCIIDRHFKSDVPFTSASVDGKYVFYGVCKTTGEIVLTNYMDIDIPNNVTFVINFSAKVLDSNN